MTGYPASAVVVGASVAGLLAARALAGSGVPVTLLERDRLPDDASVRTGVPHSRHVHVLLQAGQEALEALLPGCCVQLRARGAVALAMPDEVQVLTPSGWIEPMAATHTLLSATRVLVEGVVRRRVLDAGGIVVRQGVDVVGLLRRGPDVAGVQLRQRGSRSAAEELAADLVVDATGRGSAAPRWLHELGLPLPREERVDSGLRYASRLFAVPPGADPRAAAIVQPSPPEISRSGILMPVEHGRWLVTLTGRGREQPPRDDAAWRAFAASLRSPLLADLTAHAEPLSPIVGFARTANVRRRFAAGNPLFRQPEGLVLVGDAACALNPAYAQGMSVAALGARALAEELTALGRQDGAGRAHRHASGQAGSTTPRLQRAVNRAADGAWQMAVGADGRYRGTAGAARSPLTSLVNRYLDAVLARSTVDPLVYAAVGNAVHLLAPPTSLLTPRVAARLLIGPRRPDRLPPRRVAPGAEARIGRPTR